MPRFELAVPLGNKTLKLQGEAEDLKDLIEQLEQFSFLPTACSYCEGVELAPEKRTAKTRDGDEVVYYSIRCTNSDCRAEFKFGQRRKGGLFPKGWDRYEGGSGGGGRDEGEEIPFA